MSLKFCYTNGDTFEIMTFALKEDIERSLTAAFFDSFDGVNVTLTDEAFYNFAKSYIPEGATGIRELSGEEHIAAASAYRKHREAWCDVTDDGKINIDMTKAKDIALTRLRGMRQECFIELGFPIRLDPAVEEAIVPVETRTKLQELRDVTEPLKALDTAGKYDDDALLAQIDELSAEQVLDAIVEG